MRGDVKDNLDKLGDFPNFSLKAIIYLYNLYFSIVVKGRQITYMMIVKQR